MGYDRRSWSGYNVTALRLSLTTVTNRLPKSSDAGVFPDSGETTASETCLEQCSRVDVDARTIVDVM